ncbi:MAG TPA: thioredoxin family protein [Tepidisphaeraceae bacterium]|nr:thioredoxin family protein [Tepidisphaeraceae bacterium]
MRSVNLFVAALMMVGFVANFAKADVKVGDMAPSFTLEDQNGKTHSLSDYAGKVVVLEWFNDECPYVQKHYKEGHMNALAKQYEGKEVVWLAVNSSNFTANDKNKSIAEKWSIDRPILNDASGATGKAYGAKTTPDMFVIGTDGKVLYKGAIDNNSDSETSSIASAENHVAKALDEVLADKPVTKAETKPYGCSVKYAK